MYSVPAFPSSREQGSGTYCGSFRPVILGSAGERPRWGGLLMVLRERAKAPSGRWRGLIGYTTLSLQDQRDKVDQTIGKKVPGVQ
jgi:hypothetical protein